MGGNGTENSKEKSMDHLLVHEVMTKGSPSQIFMGVIILQHHIVTLYFFLWKRKVITEIDTENTSILLEGPIWMQTISHFIFHVDIKSSIGNDGMLFLHMLMVYDRAMIFYFIDHTFSLEGMG